MKYNWSHLDKLGIGLLFIVIVLLVGVLGSMLVEWLVKTDSWIYIVIGIAVLVLSYIVGDGLELLLTKKK
jgi:cytochrome c biogenesis protein CcdA